MPEAEVKALKRLGRTDGRYGVPDLTVSDSAVTTPARAFLVHALYEECAGLRATWDTRRIDIEQRFSVSSDERAAIEQDLKEVQAEIDREAADRSRSTNWSDERGWRDRNTPEDVVRDRYRRRRDRNRSALLNERDRLQQALKKHDGAKAARSAELGKLGAETVRDAERQYQLFRARRAAYDHALIARHPDGLMLAHQLDTSDPPKPDWLTDLKRTMGDGA
ncbi:hypothetical protein [Cryptosporangium sp. NPDC048952]|uniref:hypothetical protein n=1 Tax=Cryptosporangium sp. NPDC048952 TaxID=3363961 RepID=UPI0037155000